MTDVEVRLGHTPMSHQSIHADEILRRAITGHLRLGVAADVYSTPERFHDMEYGYVVFIDMESGGKHVADLCSIAATRVRRIATGDKVSLPFTFPLDIPAWALREKP